MRAGSISLERAIQGTTLAGARLIAAPNAAVHARRAFKAQAALPNSEAKQTARVLATGDEIKGTQAGTVGVSKKKSGVKLPLGFTESNELFLGRLAMLGFASSIIGELLTGKGALAQLGLETGVPVFELDWAIVGLAGFNLVAALLPARSDEEGPAARPAATLQDQLSGEFDVLRVFDIKRFGFTKDNEIFVGRCAQLGFAASLLGEALTGKGIIGQFDAETGLPLAATPFLLGSIIVFSLTAAVATAMSIGKSADQ